VIRDIQSSSRAFSPRLLSLARQRERSLIWLRGLRFSSQRPRRVWNSREFSKEIRAQRGISSILRRDFCRKPRGQNRRAERVFSFAWTTNELRCTSLPRCNLHGCLCFEARWWFSSLITSSLRKPDPHFALFYYTPEGRKVIFIKWKLAQLKILW